jgi:DNA topoisomerase-1
MDDDGSRRDVRSEDVNEYLREISGRDFSAKDFRTWAGTVLAARALREFDEFESKVQAKKNIVAAVESVAGKLGNTPAVCKKCYIHPQVIDSYLEGTLIEMLGLRVKSARGLPADEIAVLGLLERRLTTEEKLARSIKKEIAARPRRHRSVFHSRFGRRK